MRGNALSLQWARRVRGNLHGSIDISQLEDRVIAHPGFQRLRRVKQTSFLNLVFPGASHSRFEHSLGAMHLAGIAFDRIVENQRRIGVVAARYPSFADLENQKNQDVQHGVLSETFALAKELRGSVYVLQALRLAALMHDLGHPPFSHSGERFLPSYDKFLQQSRGKIPDYLVEYLEASCEKLTQKGQDPKKKKVRHEIYTLVLVDQILTDIYFQYPDNSLVIAPRDVVSIIEPAIDPEDSSELAKLKVGPVCSKLVSGEVDIDRMDYLLRDSKECGVVYGNFDKDRILDSLALYYHPADDKLHLAIQYSGLAAFEDYLRARQSMFLQLYFHKTSVSAEAMLQHLSEALPDFSLPVSSLDYIRVDEYNISQHLITAIEASDKQEEEKQFLLDTFDDLTLHRRLWKRVYEVTTGGPNSAAEESLNTAEEVLKSLGVKYQKISSTNQLTKFKARQHNHASTNYLRLIKKDEGQFPRVMPIEDFSEISKESKGVQIQRLYSEYIGDIETLKVKQAISKAFHDKTDTTL